MVNRSKLISGLNDSTARLPPQRLPGYSPRRSSHLARRRSRRGRGGRRRRLETDAAPPLVAGFANAPAAGDGLAK